MIIADVAVVVSKTPSVYTSLKGNLSLFCTTPKVVLLGTLSLHVRSIPRI